MWSLIVQVQCPELLQSSKMRICAAFLPLFFTLLAFGSPTASGRPVELEKRAVSTAVFSDLLFYYQYASSAFSTLCARPNGNTLVLTINNNVTDTQGFIARDDNRKEIVVSMRGSTSAVDWIIDLGIPLVPFISYGVAAPPGTLVHLGFLTAWNSVAEGVISSVTAQLAAYPGYSIVTTGHSLGGALSSLVGISLQQNFPNSKHRMFTYGQPRTGNVFYANFVNSAIGINNIFRVTHTIDVVPALPPTILGYHHHATEFWQTPDPATATTTKQCDTSGEDPSCSASNGPFTAINDAHTTYFNFPAGTAFCS